MTTQVISCSTKRMSTAPCRATPPMPMTTVTLPPARSSPTMMPTTIRATATRMTTASARHPPRTTGPITGRLHRKTTRGWNSWLAKLADSGVQGKDTEVHQRCSRMASKYTTTAVHHIRCRFQGCATMDRPDGASSDRRGALFPGTGATFPGGVAREHQLCDLAGHCGSGDTGNAAASRDGGDASRG